MSHLSFVFYIYTESFTFTWQHPENDKNKLVFTLNMKPGLNSGLEAVFRKLDFQGLFFTDPQNTTEVFRFHQKTLM